MSRELPTTPTTRERGPSTTDLELAREFKQRLARHVDPARFEVVLFGSRARGEAEPESDIDVFVRFAADDLSGQVKAWVDELAVELTLERGLLFSAFLADRDFMERHRGFSLLEAVRADGVVV